MTMNLPTRPKVSVHGVGHDALHLARACALNDNPICGIYDPDPEKALRAALFLGVSAHPTLEQLLSDQPDVILCTNAISAQAFQGLCIDLFASDCSGNHCCALSATHADTEIPSSITSEPPGLVFRLSGEAEAVEATRRFLGSLSEHFTCH